MPWTQETPYVMQSHRWVDDKADELFHASEADQKQAFERDKISGVYKRLWRGKGNTPDQNDWKTLEEWSDDAA
jgi:hypothetical protein